MIHIYNKFFHAIFFILLFVSTLNIDAQTWVSAGSSPFAPNGYVVNSTSDGTSPYIVFYDKDYSYKLSVKKFDGTTWNYIGNPGFGNSATASTIYSKGTSLYVGYLDIDANYKLTVKKFDGTSWVTVGQPGIGPQYLSSVKLAVVKDTLFASYYANSYVNVLKYDGTAWVGLPNSNVSTIYDNATTVEIAAYKDTLARLYYSLGGTNVVLQIYKNNQWSTLGKTNLTSDNFFKLGIDQSNRPCVLAGKSSGNGVYVIRYNGVKWDTLGTAVTSKDVHEAAISFIGDIPFVALGELNSSLLYPVVYKFELNAWAQFGSLRAASSDDIGIATAGNKVYAFYGQATNGTADFNSFAVVNTYSLPSQTITFPVLSQKTIGDIDFNLTATASSGLPVTYTSSNTSVATVSGSSVTIIGSGVTTITAKQPGNTYYSAASNVSQTLTVNAAVKQDQTITFTSLPVKSVGTNFNPGATASSGIPVTYTSSNTAVATASGSTITMVGVGSTTITAVQIGNYDYNAAISVTQTLTVEKGDQIIIPSTFPEINMGDYTSSNGFYLSFHTDSWLPLTYTSSNPDVATIGQYNSVIIIGAGTTIITASQAGDANYNAAPNVTQTLTVNKNDQRIYFNPLPSFEFGVGDLNLSAAASSALPVTFASSNPDVAVFVSGSILTVIGVGTTIITVSQAGSEYYNAAAGVSQTLTILKADQTITFDVLSGRNIGDPTFNLTAAASSDLNVMYSSSNTSVATVSGNVVTIVGAGSTTITASQVGDANYNAADDVTQTLIVAKGDQTITFSALTDKTVGDANFDLSVNASSGLAITYTSSNTAVAIISGNTVTIVGAGSTTITASQAGDANYNAATNIIQTLTVEKADQTITFSTLADKVLGDANFDLPVNASSGLAITYTSSNTAVATISGNAVTIIGVGSTTITASQAGDANYNAATDITQTLAVEKASQTMTFSTLADKVLGDANFDLTATTNSGLTIIYTSSNTAVATISGNTVTIVGAGSTTITASQTGNANYNGATDITQTLTVENTTPTGTAAILASASIELFPNPTSNNLNVQFKDAFDHISITVYTLEGNAVYTKQIESIANNATDMDVTKLPQGIYFVEIKTDQGTLVKRLIKQ